jgi:hypothetical protein
MKTLVYIKFGILMVSILCLLTPGCGSKSESEVVVQNESNNYCSSLCQSGYDYAVRYREGDLPAYRIVIELRLLAESEREEFLNGFQRAYNEANDRQRGIEYSNILSQALEGGFYDEAFKQGKLYVSGEITDIRIQELISGSVGLSRGSGLGWKAGYIAGFAHEMVRRGSGFIGNEDIFYSQGETKYNALRGPLGV